ncbi:MAG TPA: farnesyl diphosphate synthase [Candidatus Binataceae bacterium]|jgi:geranylgeranyl diphosphate synthase type II
MRDLKAHSARSIPLRTGRTRRGLRLAFRLEAYLHNRAATIERALSQSVPEPAGPAARLFESMRYSLLAGGKRLRPVLALASCEAVGGKTDAALGLACALEMIHTYSLIHDDLPCMDDDDLRRGRPTNHKVYGDALATLAGDALLADAFKILASSRPRASSPVTVLEVVAELARAAGSAGMVGGQVIDIESEGQDLDISRLEHLHARKTGALFVAAVRGGARIGGASPSQLERLTVYSRALGLAFQVIDDILDCEATTEQMGKRTQKDGALGKATYPSLMGLEQSRGLARDLNSRALEALGSFDHRADPLRALASFVVERNL